MGHSSVIRRAGWSLVVAGALATAGCGSNSSKTSSQASAAKGTTATAIPPTSSLASLGTLRPPGPPGSSGPEGVPIPNVPAVADRTSTATGGTVDGIQCLGSEQTLFHIHAHLTL
ncbi:MAG TPA: hypothetical protein VG165_06905, partial [Solirubrobacteraceae bacterium]|nr:hypothetical protein [Solirubrobacteraceae bacterium]